MRPLPLLFRIKKGVTGGVIGQDNRNLVTDDIREKIALRAYDIYLDRGGQHCVLRFIGRDALAIGSCKSRRF